MEYDGYRLGVLLDPSLLLGEKSLQEVMEYVDQLNLRGFGYRFYLPPAFITAVEKMDPQAAEIEFYIDKARTADIKHIKDLMHILGKKSVLHTYEIPEHTQKRYAGMYGALLQETANKELAEMLFQEWVFLQEKNLMISRIKKPFTYYIKAGAVSIEYSGKMMDVQREDAVVDLEALRKIGGWTALAGEPIKEAVKGLKQTLPNQGLFILAGAE